MRSLEMRKKAQELLNALESAHAFNEATNILTQFSSKVFSDIDEIIKKGQNQNGDQLITQCRDKTNQVKKALAKVNIRSFYSSLENILNSMQEYDEFIKKDLTNQELAAYTIEIELVELLQRKIVHFEEEFVKTLSYPNGYNIVPLIYAADNIKSLILGLKVGLNALIHYFRYDSIHVENFDRLSIHLPSKMNLVEFSLKLISINNIYVELCSLMNVSENDYPLKIGKIESGSLWANLFGESKVVNLIVDFLSSSAGYVYRNFTAEGKLTAIPQKLNSVNEVLEFTKKLEEAGLDTTIAKEHLEKSAICIAKDLNSLLDGQAKIEVNDQEYSVAQELENKLLSHKETLKINHFNTSGFGEYNNSKREGDET